MAVLVPWFIVVCVFLCPGAPECSTCSGSSFKAFQKMGPQLKVSSNRLGEVGIKLRTHG